MNYLAGWRMQVATQKLRNTNASLAQIADMVGYHSEAAFLRAFKKAFGVAPATWRRSNSYKANFEACAFEGLIQRPGLRGDAQPWPFLRPLRADSERICLRWSTGSHRRAVTTTRRPQLCVLANNGAADAVLRKPRCHCVGSALAAPIATNLAGK